MMTLFLIGFAGTAMILGSIPFVMFALMLETCSARRLATMPATSTRKESSEPMGFARAA